MSDINVKRDQSVTLWYDFIQHWRFREAGLSEQSAFKEALSKSLLDH